MKNIYKLFVHFEERLLERYGIRVSYKEYKALGENPVIFLRRQKSWTGKWSTIGLMTIKEQEVLVVQANRGKFLITALPEYNKTQYPNYIQLIKERQMNFDNDLVRISRKPEAMLTRREKRKLGRAMEAKAQGDLHVVQTQHKDFLKKAVEADAKIDTFNKLIVESNLNGTQGKRKMGLYIAYAVIIAIILFMLLSVIL